MNCDLFLPAVDECARNPCTENENCINQGGSYKCTCKPGFGRVPGGICEKRKFFYFFARKAFLIWIFYINMCIFFFFSNFKNTKCRCVESSHSVNGSISAHLHPTILFWTVILLKHFLTIQLWSLKRLLY